MGDLGSRVSGGNEGGGFAMQHDQAGAVSSLSVGGSIRHVVGAPTFQKGLPEGLWEREHSLPIWKKPTRVKGRALLEKRGSRGVPQGGERRCEGGEVVVAASKLFIVNSCVSVWCMNPCLAPLTPTLRWGNAMGIWHNSGGVNNRNP